MNLTSPVSRKDDLESSREGEAEINESGARANQQAILYQLVTERPGLTSLEMTRFCDLNRYQIARRLADLKNGGFLRQGNIRMCTLGNRSAVEWFLAEVPQ